MTPKEKAQDLIEKCTILHYMKLGKGKGLPISMYESQKKGCALVVVNEIIDAISEDHTSGSQTYKYWSAVKQELEAL